MSADLLRRAAAVLRERAQDATPGPWLCWDGWGPTSDGLMGFARLGPDSGERVFIHDEQRNLYATKADAEWVCTMHPLVGLALADWLEAVGVEREGLLGRLIASYGAKAAEDFMPADGPEVAVARLILGEQS